MFDHVFDGNKPFRLPCPTCTEEVSGFQSKAGECTLSNVDWRKLPRFHGHCQACGRWIDLEVEQPVLTRRIMTTDGACLLVEHVTPQTELEKPDES
jgi:hypothetical protein